MWWSIFTSSTLRQRMNISEFGKKAYLASFKLKIFDQGGSWVPHKVCKQRVENRSSCAEGNEYNLVFLVWRELLLS